MNQNLSKLKEMLAEELNKSKEKSAKQDSPESIVEMEDTITRLSNHFMKGSKPSTLVEQDSLEPLNQKFVTFDQMNRHYSDFLAKIQTQLSSLGGGGEVNFRNLDDVDRSTIAPNRHLAYNATTDKFFFEDVTGSEPQVQSDWTESDTGNVAFIKNKPAPLVDDDYTISIASDTISVINLPANTAIGPIEQLHFNLDHAHEEERLVGTLCWDPDDQTLNLTHPGGVTQQIGQEQYVYVRNGTANTIPNGTVVQFSGAEQEEVARLLVAPMLADGTFPSLYGLGVATQDIEPDEDGRVTVWGKVRGLDMSDYSVGDILYASPTEAGGFVNVKPRAPNNVLPVAAVLNNSADAGEIFVRPTVEQKMSYGVFVRTADFTNSGANTANTVPMTTTEVSNGVTLGTGGNASRMSVDQSGLYQIDWTLHFNTTGGTFAEDTWYTWIRVNGTDVPNTMRRGGIDGEIPNGVSPSFTRCLLLDVDDYVEICIAVSNTRVRLDGDGTTAFGPATAAIEVSIAQVQL